MIKKLVFPLLVFSAFLMNGQNTAKYNTVVHHSNLNSPKSNIFFIDFESFGLLPPQWDSIVTGTSNWKLSYVDPHGGFYYASCYCDSILSVPQNEWLISPSVDLTGYTTVSLNFWFQFSKYWGLYPKDNYDLLILVSSDGVNFTDTVWDETLSDTATWDSYDWVNDEVNLSSYIGTTIKIAFVYSGYDGAEASLDDILLSTIGTNGEMKELALAFYPNPSNDKILITTVPSALLSVYSSDGKLVYSTITETEQFQLDISSFDNGFYTAKISSGGKIVTKTFVKN